MEQNERIIELLIEGKSLSDIREQLNIPYITLCNQILSKGFKKEYIEAINNLDSDCDETTDSYTQNNETEANQNTAQNYSKSTTEQKTFNNNNQTQMDCPTPQLENNYLFGFGNPPSFNNEDNLFSFGF